VVESQSVVGKRAEVGPGVLTSAAGRPDIGDMALDFPPDFPFNRQPTAPATREPIRLVGNPAVVAATGTLQPSAVEARASALATAAPAPRVNAASAGAAPLVERRRSPRQTLVAKASIRPDTAVQVTSLIQAGFVSNISMNGVGFHTRKPLEIGGTYRITLELGPLKWASRLKVITCRHDEDSETFDVGGQFIGNELSRLPMAA
jgi:hypothetical protein